MDHPALIAFFLLFCIVISFLMSGMEAGVLALNPWRVRRNSQQGNHSAILLARYLDNPEDFLWTTLVGNTLAAFAAFCMLIFGLSQWMTVHPYAFFAVLIFMVFLFYIFGDLLPKLLFRSYPTRFCQVAARPFHMCSLAFRPLTLLVEVMASFILGGQQAKSYTGRLRQSREEMRRIVNETSGSVTATERSLINKVLDLHNRNVRDVMIPLEKTICIDLKTRAGDMLKVAAERFFSRFPVWDSLEQRKQIVGIAQLKNTLYGENVDLRQTAAQFMYPPLNIRENIRLDDAMETLQNSKRRLAIVVDWKGRPIGIITLQDILKTIFGEVSL